MSASRASFPRVPRRAAMLAISFALMLRVLVPAGWMPVADARGVHLELCPAAGPTGAPAAAAEHGGHEMMAAPMSGTGHEGGHKSGHEGTGKSNDQPCAFGGLLLAMTQAEGPGLLAPALAPETPIARPLPVTVGRGLAAPPPPATGPPILS